MRGYGASIGQDALAESIWRDDFRSGAETESDEAGLLLVVEPDPEFAPALGSGLAIFDGRGYPPLGDARNGRRIDQQDCLVLVALPVQLGGGLLPVRGEVEAGRPLAGDGQRRKVSHA